MPYSPMHKHCIQMKDHKGKTTGLMMEGSVAHMESALKHAGKSKLHAKPEKDYPDDGHLHYQDGKKVESPGVSETKKLSDTSGAVGQMSPYKMHNKEHLQKVGKDMPLRMDHGSPAEFTGMSGGSALHQDADLSDMANLLFGEKKITKKQAKKAKEQVLANPMAKDTLKTKKPKKVETKK